jgi:hypothetical protein
LPVQQHELQGSTEVHSQCTQHQHTHHLQALQVKVVWKYHMLAHWDVCGGVPANYQLTEEDKQLCISKRDLESVLKAQR